ncbi:MAG: FMN-binding protein [Paludibacter sp.]|jgi:hypothetical protein|nr:FMN-binding protein [Paludibacter sp.]
MKQFLFSLALLVVTLQAVSQHKHSREAEPVLTQVSNKAIVQSVFPTATKVEKVNELWYKISDDKNKLFGYAMNSINHCQDIIGYNHTTPVMIITDTKYIIKKIALLSHYETRGYVRRMQQTGFFNAWDELPLKDALKIEPDGWSGATITAEAVKKNVDFLVTKGLTMMPDGKKRK